MRTTSLDLTLKDLISIDMDIDVNTMNFPVEYNGKTYWVSRSCALVGFIYVKNLKGEWCVLAEKRGPGCPDEIGKWCVPCGYIERNKESGPEGLVRECFEETGIMFEPESFKLVAVSYDRDEKQNICHYFKCVLGDISAETIADNFDTSHSEPDEVDGLRFIPLSEADKYQWAFNHKGLVKKVFETTTEIPVI